MNTPAANILISLGIALMIVPHHYDSQNQPMRLATQLVDLLGSFNDFLKPGMPLLWILFLLGYLAPLAPGLIACSIAPQQQPPITFAALGISLLILAVPCMCVIYISDVSFGFGGGSHSGTPTWFARIIPIAIAASGLLMLTSSLSPPVRQFLQRALLEPRPAQFPNP
ncbi:MAG: hypothetical protein H7210_14065 [Pyrinomonadaceae bacterium]|nr:hypothetical protein [Phycisphaerales bacterium]